MHCPDNPAPAARPCFSAVLSSNTADVISSFRLPAALPICYVVTVLCVLRDFENPFFIFVKRPQVVFFIEIGGAACCLHVFLRV